jgi:hypothetical protein
MSEIKRRGVDVTEKPLKFVNDSSMEFAQVIVVAKRHREMTIAVKQKN